MTNDILQRRLIRFLVAYEALVILACLAGGYAIATMQGGTWWGATPLLLVAAAEMLRVPTSAWATRIGGFAKGLSFIVLLAIAVLSFEAMTLIAEVFLDNRTGSVMAVQRRVDLAQAAFEKKAKEASDARANLDVAREKVRTISADIQTKEQHPPAQPSIGGKPCTARDGRAVTCSSDASARQTFKLAQTEHIETLRTLRAESRRAQGELDTASRVAGAVTVAPEQATLDAARQDLSDTMHLSPFHRLAASVLGVRVADLTEGQFESVKRWGVLGIAGAFATLSMAVSVVAHSAPSNEESKLSRSLRAYLARRRKAVVRVEYRDVNVGEKIVEKIVEKPVDRVIVKYLPAPFAAGELESRTGRRGMPTFAPARPDPLPSSILEVGE